MRSIYTIMPTAVRLGYSLSDNSYLETVFYIIISRNPTLQIHFALILNCSTVTKSISFIM
jgi:hypothetical protein